MCFADHEGISRQLYLERGYSYDGSVFLFKNLSVIFNQCTNSDISCFVDEFFERGVVSTPPPPHLYCNDEVMQNVFATLILRISEFPAAILV